MVQFSKVLLLIDNMHTVPPRALDCEKKVLSVGWGQIMQKKLESKHAHIHLITPSYELVAA